MLIVAENVPEEVAVTVAGVVISCIPSNFIVMVLLALKPEPETVTVVPAGPEVGDSVIVIPDEDDMLNVAVAVTKPSVADTV